MKIPMETKSRRTKIIFIVILLAALAAWVLPFALTILPNFPDYTFALLEPKGMIAEKQRALIIWATLIMLIAVVPMYVFLFFVLKKFGAGKTHDQFSPDQTASKKSNFILWAIPGSIIVIISCIIWTSTHDLDPYKPIESNIKPITIQVVSLRWKWLFIYPEQNIATVNYLQFPVNTPINFELTSDGPMTTFWIPQLGGQVYTMAAMNMSHHLIANELGEFVGQSSEINGKGYAGMRFVANSTSQEDFEAWVKKVKTSPQMLHEEEYKQLLEPSENHPQSFYSMVEKNLYQNIIMKYMAPVKK